MPSSAISSRKCRQEEAVLLLEEIEEALDDSSESDQVKVEPQKLRCDFNLQLDVIQPIDDYDKFKEVIGRVKYSGRLAAHVPDLEERMENDPTCANLLRFNLDQSRSSLPSQLES